MNQDTDYHKAIPDKEYQKMSQDQDYQKTAGVNSFIHRYMIAVIHALLWVAALSLAAYFHVSPRFDHTEALLFSTLSAYGAYLCESVLSTVNVMAQSSGFTLSYRKAGLWGWISLNICLNVALSLLFLHFRHWIFIVLVILTAGWQKYMDGRIPVRLISTRKPLKP